MFRDPTLAGLNLEHRSCHLTRRDIHTTPLIVPICRPYAPRYAGTLLKLGQKHPTVPSILCLVRCMVPNLICLDQLHDFTRVTHTRNIILVESMIYTYLALE